MKISEPRYSVKIILDVLIPMRDGVELACNLYIPDAPGKFPAVLAHYPYQKDGWILLGFFPDEFYEFARRGYVHVCMDMRGTGCSEGTIPELMRDQQREDGYDVGGEHYKRVPRGYDPDHPRAELLRYNGLHVELPRLERDVVTTRALVTACAASFARTAPLHRWLVDLVHAAQRP